MTQEQRAHLQSSNLHLSKRNSVKSPYTLSKLVGDFPFFQEITQDIKTWQVTSKRDGESRATGEKIDFPLEVCPLGTATGDMTFWSYCWKQQQQQKPYLGFTLELGNKDCDLFYPNKYQMIDIIHNSRSILVNALEQWPH